MIITVQQQSRLMQLRKITFHRNMVHSQKFRVFQHLLNPVFRQQKKLNQKAQTPQTQREELHIKTVKKNNCAFKAYIVIVLNSYLKSD